MKTGDIYLVNLDPTIGDEIQKKRPVVVLNPGDAKNLQLAIVVPVTGWKKQWDDHAFFLVLEPGALSGISKKSAVDCFQIRAISHDRFIKRLGELTEEQSDKIKSAIALILDIEERHCQ